MYSTTRLDSNIINSLLAASPTRRLWEKVGYAARSIYPFGRWEDRDEKDSVMKTCSRAYLCDNEREKRTGNEIIVSGEKP